MDSVLIEDTIPISWVTRMLRNLESGVARCPRPLLWAVLPLIVAGVGSLDFAIGYDFQFFIFYFIPVSIYAYFLGAGAGTLTSLLSTGTIIAVDLLAGQVHASVMIPVWNTLIRLLTFLFITFLLSRLQAELHFQTGLSLTDPLTGLSNRRGFELAALPILDLAGRSGAGFSFAYLDLDGFKQINDSRGHSEGDKVLQEMARLLREQLKGRDLVGRLGGDEFGILLPDTGAEQAFQLLMKIQEELVRRAAGHGWPLTFSAGLVASRPHGEALDSFLSRADALMYQVKKSGRGRILMEPAAATGHPGVGV